MRINLKLGRNYDRLMTGMQKAPEKMAGAIEEGVTDFLFGAVREVKSDPRMTSGGTQGLFVRTGNLRSSVKTYADTDSRWHGFVGPGDDQNVSAYSWLLGDEQHVIKPKSGKMLAIPVGDNKTKAGVSGNLFASPRDVPDGFFFKSKGKLLFGREEGGRVQTLFLLLPSVLVQGRGILPDVMEREEPKLKKKVWNSIQRGLTKLGLRN